MIKGCVEAERRAVTCPAKCFQKHGGSAVFEWSELALQPLCRCNWRRNLEYFCLQKPPLLSFLQVAGRSSSVSFTSSTKSRSGVAELPLDLVTPDFKNPPLSKLTSLHNHFCFHHNNVSIPPTLLYCFPSLDSLDELRSECSCPFSRRRVGSSHDEAIWVFLRRDFFQVVSLWVFIGG